MKLRILAHERNTDNIRIGAAFHQNTYSLDEIADDTRDQYAKRGADKLDEYHCLVAIVDASTLKRLYTIHQDNGYAGF